MICRISFRDIFFHVNSVTTAIEPIVKFCSTFSSSYFSSRLSVVNEVGVCKQIWSEKYFEIHNVQTVWLLNKAKTGLTDEKVGVESLSEIRIENRCKQNSFKKQKRFNRIFYIHKNDILANDDPIKSSQSLSGLDFV